MDLHPRVVARTKSDRFATQLGLTFSIQNRHVIGGQPRLRLDADEKRRSPSRGYALTREILALEAKGESSLLKTFPHCNPAVLARIDLETREDPKIAKYRGKIS